ncbi:MAG: anti-sigma factor [Caldilineae bacterium]|nr:anti-sigma factor [Anaerolineae bacterium]MCB0198641.1 anti-sigma factor [Anaerolineae bacterium]MCB0205021.1 anti-sigma factor [Anaerolineae bacterium]MCB0253548.1 anti-sigma factor [Anaerolineae bacterium]MCB9152809.1 anti-sigma factor [Caldilineae bacterium]
MAPEEKKTDCTEIHELIGAYCLGATDPDETGLVEAHLAECPEAAAEAAEYHALAETLLFSATPVEPPASLSASLLAATAPSSDAPLSVALPVQTKAEDTSPSLWHRIQAALAGLSLRPLPVLAGIAVVTLLAANLYLISQIGALQSSVDALQSQAGQQVAVLTQVGEGAYLRIGLPAGPAGIATDAYGALVCSPDQPQGFLLAENLPVLQPGHAYQVWLGQGDIEISAGLFNANAAGYGKLVFTAPLPMGQYDSLLVTEEPATGSSQPTTPPTIGGSIYGEEYQS